ncbi:MAG TPA: anti-sigma factor [Acidimicrobiales bacterium]|nr:anti-sigma factor [Acidimicrobiales bacterium]
MAGQLTHAEIQELLGVYALDAVDTDEAEQVGRHLLECPRCADEVASHREVAASMAHVGAAAPEGVWERIADGLEEPPPELDLRRVQAMAPRRGRTVPLRGVAAIAAVAAALVAVLGIHVVRQDDRIDRLASLTAERNLQGAVTSALFDSQARTVELRSGDGRVFAKAVVQRDGTGYLVPDQVPPLADGRTYQLWGMVGGTPVSLGVLGPAPGVVAFKAVADVSALAVTDEPAGGVAVPNLPPRFVGALQA